MKEFKSTLGGNKWTISPRAYINHPDIGTCDPAAKTIQISGVLSGKIHLDTIIHELMHAVLPNHDEDFINETATEMAAAMWKLNVRVIEED